MIKTIKDIKISQLRVLIRVDFNVPMDKQRNILDDTRIKAALPTIKYALENKAKIILMTHLGRPKGEFNPQYSVIPVAQRLAELLEEKEGIIVPDSCIGDGVKSLALSLKDGNIMMLENLRFHEGETNGDDSFAREIASLASIYINDAFGVMHRSHASVTGVPKFVSEKGIGFLVEKELKAFERLLHNYRKPYTVVLGGAKVSDKIGLIMNLLEKVDNIIIGGAMANTFLAAQGVKLGKSKVENEKISEAKRILSEAEKLNVKIYLPVDFVATTDLDNDKKNEVVSADNFPEDLMAVDIGEKSCEIFSQVISESKTIFWNGPMGVYEIPQFKKGTDTIANAIAQSSSFSVVGGGDSVAALNGTGLIPFISHISTGGGASLLYLSGEELPGLKALEV